MVNYTIPLSLHGIILLPEEWRLNATYVKKNMTLLRRPIEKGLDILGGKWKSRILCVLAQRGPIRYGQFKQEMTNVTDTALSGALKELIRDGLVDRKQYNEVPLRVEYELTPYGLAAVRLLRQIADWADGSIPTGLSRGEMPLCLGCDFND